MQPLLVLCCGGDSHHRTSILPICLLPLNPTIHPQAKRAHHHHPDITQPTLPPVKKKEPNYHRQTDKSKTKMCTPSPHLNPVQKTEEWTMPELNRRPFTGRISHHVILSDNAEAKMRSENHTTRPIALVSDGMMKSLFCLLWVQCGGGHDSRSGLFARAAGNRASDVCLPR